MIHYHVLLYNMPLIAWVKIKDIWGHGGVYIEGFQDNNDKVVKLKYDNKTMCFKADGKSIKNIGAYITKTMSYMVKNIDDDRLKGRKCCFSSTKLLKPTILNDIKENEKEIKTLDGLISANNLTFVNSYENEYVGKVSFQEYNIKFNNNILENDYKNGISNQIKEDFLKVI